MVILLLVTEFGITISSTYTVFVSVSQDGYFGKPMWQAKNEILSFVRDRIS